MIEPGKLARCGQALGFPTSRSNEMTMREVEDILKALTLMKIGSFFDPVSVTLVFAAALDFVVHTTSG
eukprot:SAG31_NODE_2167_length_6269_cov_4.097731_3_plen_68_part_00